MNSASLHRIEAAMMAAISDAVALAANRAIAETHALGVAEPPPPHDYFLAVAHQKLFARLCGADPDTFAGGNAETAAFVIRNSQNICDYYWSAVPGTAADIRASTDEGD